jgi:hypothetical protein
MANGEVRKPAPIWAWPDHSEDIMSLPEGPVILRMPRHMSEADVADLEAWLQLVLHRVRRTLNAGGPPENNMVEARS